MLLSGYHCVLVSLDRISIREASKLVKFTWPMKLRLQRPTT